MGPDLAFHGCFLVKLVNVPSARCAKEMPILERAEGKLYYEVAGSGPPVLFIQGVGVVGEGWRPQITCLQSRCQTLLFDNRGIGQSVPYTGALSIEQMAADALSLMDTLGWRSAHVVGHSMGGVIAQQIALDCPQRVRSLFLACTFPRGKDAARITPWVLWMTFRTRVGTRRMRRHAFLEMLWPPDDLAQTNTDDLAQQVAALVGRDLAEQPGVLMKQLQALARHDTSARLRELSHIPTVVLSAEHDPIALPKFGRILSQSIPGARFELFPRASHGVTIQHPAEISRQILALIEGAEHRWTA